MKLILPVAGKGTRLRPHTFTKPKSLVRVAGKTVLQHVLDGLNKIDIDEFIIITDENGHIIQKYIERNYPDLNATYITQTELLGPAHAVSLASPRIKEGDDVLVVFNDTLFVTDLTRIPALCRDFDGLIYSKEVEDPKRFGVNVMKDNIIVDMIEKPDEPVSNLAQVGMYYMKNGRTFMEYINRTIKQDLRVKGEFYLPEVFKLMIKDGFKLGAPEIEEWLDCGKPETLLQTNRFLLERAKGNHVFIEGCVIIPPVSIHKTAEISHSVIGPYVSVAENCKITNSIIKNSVINPNSVLNNTMLEESLVGDEVMLTGQLQKMNIGDNSMIDLSGKN
ncbi:MAG: Bifunctional protein GlmU [bacterium ADurb.Bin157]|jgi:glucose-1-phosphate thymidylyltransferase|nr:sugar phosphate nucleotidyltransferase [Candidatus Riflebacteria bacterium]NCB47113.1 nucleotidyltransferase [bacterium]OQB50094.1 MAG: Bifunctional protein GlmU [bacterium ADurb.Bin157]MDD2624557.1 sugar phosphate nucleotidyltransferase [Candidatus Riflebacteria bacterium]MDD3377154.1 sugar phosphate nucleotidyltransferase [Candidatus Riflebacteria bacterium]